MCLIHSIEGREREREKEEGGPRWWTRSSPHTLFSRRGSKTASRCSPMDRPSWREHCQSSDNQWKTLRMKKTGLGDPLAKIRRCLGETPYTYRNDKGQNLRAPCSQTRHCDWSFEGAPNHHCGALHCSGNCLETIWYSTVASESMLSRDPLASVPGLL